MINPASTNSYVRHTNNKHSTQATTKDQAVNSKKDITPPDVLYILDLSSMKNEDTQEKLGNRSIRENERAEAAAAAEAEGEDGRPEDETRKLTRMLVAAKTPDDVQNVLMDVYGHMREWQALAAAGDKKAIAVVKKLNKLIARGNRKIRDLNEEMVKHQKQQRAEKAEKEQLAKRLELELKEAQRKRKERERKYLQERDNDEEDESAETGPTMAETEMKIRQLAAAMAALKTNTADAGTFTSYDSPATAEPTGIEGEISGESTSEEL